MLKAVGSKAIEQADNIDQYYAGGYGTCMTNSCRKLGAMYLCNCAPNCNLTICRDCWNKLCSKP